MSMRFVSFTPGQEAILKAFETHFDECAEPPTMQEIACRAGVSRGLVWQNVKPLERLGYLQVNRDKQGRIRKRGIILLMAMGEEEL